MIIPALWYRPRTLEKPRIRNEWSFVRHRLRRSYSNSDANRGLVKFATLRASFTDSAGLCPTPRPSQPPAPPQPVSMLRISHCQCVSHSTSSTVIFIARPPRSGSHRTFESFAGACAPQWLHANGSELTLARTFERLSSRWHSPSLRRPLAFQTAAYPISSPALHDPGDPTPADAGMTVRTPPGTDVPRSVHDRVNLLTHRTPD